MLVNNFPWRSIIAVCSEWFINPSSGKKSVPKRWLTRCTSAVGPVCRRGAQEIISPIRLRPKRQQRLPQPPMPLRKMQVEHFIPFAFGADDLDEVIFLFSRPRPQSRHIGQDKRKILKGCLLQRSPRRRADVTASDAFDFHI